VAAVPLPTRQAADSRRQQLDAGQGSGFTRAGIASRRFVFPHHDAHSQIQPTVWGGTGLSSPHMLAWEFASKLAWNALFRHRGDRLSRLFGVEDARFQATGLAASRPAIRARARSFSLWEDIKTENSIPFLEAWQTRLDAADTPCKKPFGIAMHGICIVLHFGILFQFEPNFVHSHIMGLTPVESSICHTA
jgi:hypothetical protein